MAAEACRARRVVGRVAFTLMALAAVAAAQGSGGRSAPKSCKPGTPPDVPSWAQDYNPEKERKAAARKEARNNKKLVEEANANGTRYDFIMYGDSIVSLAGVGRGAAVWADFFADNMTSAPLGIRGNNVEEFAWRVMEGQERFDKEPKVVYLLIGINNLEYHPLSETEAHLDTVMQWMRATMPRSNLVLLNLLPSVYLDVKKANQKWEALAEKNGWGWSTCGSDLEASDDSILYDGIHPAPAGYEQLFSCLLPEVQALLASGDPCSDPAPAGSGSSKARRRQ